MNKAIKILGKYTEEELMKMEPVSLGGLLRERTHHKVEVPLYPTLLKWKGRPIEGFGREAQIVYDVWHKKGLPEDTPDLIWVKKYLDIAAKIRIGEKPKLEEELPTPFTEEEMTVVHKLIYKRRSVREWIDKEISDEIIGKILDAGRMAPIGCNLGHIRFVILKNSEEKRMIWSDISTENAVIIVICHDVRVAKAVGQDKTVPQNPGFDAAAVGDHMLLMAHALGLGAVWLSERKGPGEENNTARKFKEEYGLPEYIEVDLHIAIGWTAIGSIKSARPVLSDMLITRRQNKD
jgi:nitroreductase